MRSGLLAVCDWAGIESRNSLLRGSKAAPERTGRPPSCPLSTETQVSHPALFFFFFFFRDHTFCASQETWLGLSISGQFGKWLGRKLG